MIAPLMATSVEATRRFADRLSGSGEHFVVAEIDGATLSPARLAELRRLDPVTLPAVDNPGRLGCPVAGIGKFVAIRLNYTDHARESNLPIPAEPIIFSKAISCIQGPDDDIVIPRGSTKTDWEVELGVVIGSRASYVGKDTALAHVADYVLLNDVSEREFQMERGGSWDKGKGRDTFGPVGPWLVTADEVGDVHVAGGQRQEDADGLNREHDLRCARDRLLRIALHDADARRRHCHGYPHRVGMGMKPTPRYLKSGDVVTLGIDKLGQQRQTCRA
jgi:2,4-diketo-3-deoxy-L-fuconate hydrolase